MDPSFVVNGKKIASGSSQCISQGFANNDLPMAKIYYFHSAYYSRFLFIVRQKRATKLLPIYLPNIDGLSTKFLLAPSAKNVQ